MCLSRGDLLCEVKLGWNTQACTVAEWGSVFSPHLDGAETLHGVSR